MAAGFVEKQNGKYYLYVFDREEDDYPLRESHVLGTENANLPTILGKLEKIYLNIPLDHLHFRILYLPFADEKKIDGIIPFQLEGMTIEGIDDIVYDSCVLGKQEDKYQIAVIFVKKDYLREVSQDLDLFGIRPELITNADIDNALTTKSAKSLSEARRLTLDEKVKAMSMILARGSINLAKGEFSYSGQMERVKQYLRYAALFLALISLLLSVHILLDIRNISANEKIIKENMIILYRRAMPGDEKVVNPLHQIKSRKKQIEEKAKELNDAKALNVMRSVAEVWNGKGMVDSLSIVADLITLKGETASVGSAQSIADSLKGKFQSNATVETKQLPGGQVGYTIQIKMKKD